MTTKEEREDYGEKTSSMREREREKQRDGESFLAHARKIS